MATEESTESTDAGQGAHGPAIAGHGKHKGKGLFNGPHREMIIMVASVVGVGLAYATLHRSSATGSSAAQTSSMAYPGSSSVLSSGQVAGFDQAAVAGLQTQLANVSDQVRALSSSGLPSDYGSGAAPSVPLASTLFAPTGSGSIVSYGIGQAEVEKDGSLFLLNGDQWSQLSQQNGGVAPQTTRVSDKFSDIPAWYSTAGNLAAVNTPATPTTAARSAT